MTEQEKYDLIERYLKNQLSESELAHFRVMLLTDPDFEEEVELQRMSHDALQSFELLELKKTMQADFDQMQSSSTKKNWGIWTAAVLGILIGLFSLDKMTSDKTTHNVTHEQKSDIKPMLKENKKVAPTTSTTSQTNTTNTSIDENLTPPPVENNNESISETTLDTNNVVEEIALAAKEKTPKVDTSHTYVQNHTKVPSVSKISPCDTTQLNLQVSHSATSKDVDNGKISVNYAAITGGKKPYRFKLDEADFQNDYQFYNLAQGSYQVWLRDAHGCETSTTVYIEENTCYADYKKTYENQYDPNWELPTDHSKAGAFTLYNRVGKIITTLSFDEGETVYWNGFANQGQKAPAGYYRFRIEYNDGQACSGELTIFE